MFGAGRPASFLMEMNPADIMPDDAIRAFTPYLSRTKDEGVCATCRFSLGV